MSDKWWHQVREFHIKFQHPHRESPVFMETERAHKRYNWMQEELDEFIGAQGLVDQVDALIDLMYFAVGTLVEMGVKPDEIFEIVHRANMTKLDNGTPLFKADGKTAKPKDWQDPAEQIQQVLEEHIQAAAQKQE